MVDDDDINYWRKISMSNGGVKHDRQKSAVQYIPPDAYLEVGHIMAYGADKYEPRNWEKGMEWSRMCGAILRHVSQFLGGEDLDPETGRSHLAHAACASMMVLAYYLRGDGTDDRGKRCITNLTPKK